MRGLLRSALEDVEPGAFRVVDVSAASDAIERVGIERVALIVTDYQMPGTDGLEFVRRIRTHRDDSVRATPIVMVSSNKGDAFRFRILQSGVSMFVAKPFNPSDLATIVRGLLRARQA